MFYMRFDLRSSLETDVNAKYIQTINLFAPFFISQMIHLDILMINRPSHWKSGHLIINPGQGSDTLQLAE